MYLKFRKISTCKFQPEFYQNVRKQIGKAYELTSAKCPDVNRLAVRISLAYAPYKIFNYYGLNSLNPHFKLHLVLVPVFHSFQNHW